VLIHVATQRKFEFGHLRIYIYTYEIIKKQKNNIFANNCLQIIFVCSPVTHLVERSFSMLFFFQQPLLHAHYVIRRFESTLYDHDITRVLGISIFTPEI